MSAPTAPRRATIHRKTNETNIQIEIDLDGNGNFSGSIGVPFFEHMLNLFARHAMIDLKLGGSGDVEIDAHHTVEDAGLTLGQAFRAAVGDRSGIARYGEAFVPMEESLARVVLDVCNRPYLRWDANIPKVKVGTFDAELAEEFFRAFINQAGITMHVSLLADGNIHHMLEAIFKACGRALRQAVSWDAKVTGVLSTKGVL